MSERISTRRMHVGELAERTGLSLRTIRHYDDVGLLPAMARTDGGFRVYSEDDFERRIVIKQMKPLGFSLEEMAEILDILAAADSADACDGRSGRLTEYREKAIHQRDEMARNLIQADDFIHRLGRQS